MQRYKFYFDSLADCSCDIDQNDNGRYYRVEEVDAEVAALKERIKELEGAWNYKEKTINKLYAENTALREALENIVLWAKGSTCEICGEKKMTDTDAYDYAKAALEQKERRDEKDI